MDNDTNSDNSFAELADSMGLTVEEARALTPKLTLEERGARSKAESAKVGFVPMTVDRLRSNLEEHTRGLYKAVGHAPEDVARLTATHMDTVTDEALIQSWQQAGQDIQAAKNEQVRQAVADEERKKAAARIKRDQEDKLTAAAAKVAEAEESASKWQKRSRSLESQIEGLFKAQRGH
jgi:hypothetical protein